MPSKNSVDRSLRLEKKSIQHDNITVHRHLVTHVLGKMSILTRENVELPSGRIDILGLEPSMERIVNRIKIIDKVISIPGWKIIYALQEGDKSQREISQETGIQPPYTRYLLRFLSDYGVVESLRISYHNVRYRLLRLVPPIGKLTGYKILSQKKVDLDEFYKFKPSVNELYVCVPKRYYKRNLIKDTEPLGILYFTNSGKYKIVKPAELINDGNPTIYGHCDYIYFSKRK